MCRRSPMSNPARVVLAVLLTAAPVVAQAPAQATGPGGGDDSGRMITPTPVGGQGYSMEFATETPRTNYITGGLNFTTAYDDGVASNGSSPISDVIYTVWPTIGLNQSRSHLSWNFLYSPGFTFYQKETALNQANQTASLGLNYRLSPHVALSVFDTFQKTSDALNQSGQNPANSGIGGVLNTPVTVIAPVADQISNSGAISISYQFAANAMVGASGIFSFLEFPNPGQAVGFSNSHARGGNAFYSRRFSGRHYIGATYGYQDYHTTQNLGPNSIAPETESQSLLLFYTFYLTPRTSFSLNGGPQRAATNGVVTNGVVTNRVVEWTPAIQGSIGWRGPRTSVAASAGHSINAGNGLSGASNSTAASASVRRQLSSHFTAGVSADYSDNKTLGAVTSLATNGHTLSGNASLQVPLGEHLGLGIGYTRLHQTYSNITGSPDRDRVWASLSYQFRRPIGR